MAGCDKGYLCEVCGEPCEDIVDSDLYLGFIIGLISADTLTKTPERHILCNPVEAQFIVHPDFKPVVVEGPFAKAELDADYVREQESLLTRGWVRLQEVCGLGIPVSEYPLDEVRRRGEITVEAPETDCSPSTS